MTSASSPPPALAGLGSGAHQGRGEGAAPTEPPGTAMQVSPPTPTPAAIPVPIPLGEVFALAAEFERAGRLPESGRLLAHARAAAPDQPDVLHLAGIVAFREKRPQEALALMERAIQLGTDTALYLRNICEVYRTLGRLDDALAAATRAATLAPNDPMALHNLAIIHYERLDPDAAIDCARRALKLDPTMPGAHFELAEALLLKGQLQEGWHEYEWRYRIAGAAPLMPATDKPQWDGTPLPHATLLLIADQGFGDVIQFARYIAWAAQRCPNIAIACSAEVAPLLTQMHPTARIFQRWEDCPPYAAFCPLSGLPRLHGTRVETIPAPIPYLHADPARTATWRTRLDGLVPAGYRRIGIVWAGRPTHNNDRNRSAGLPAFAALANLPRTALISLQKGDAAAQSGNYFGRAPLVNLGAEIQDYGDTMAIMATLDLMVTVDTSVAHLAGAMGRPIWVLLPRAPDWRWLMDREDTPWYPTMRLFRQDPDRDWRKVMSRIAEAARTAK